MAKFVIFFHAWFTKFAISVILWLNLRFFSRSIYEFRDFFLQRSFEEFCDFPSKIIWHILWFFFTENIWRNLLFVLRPLDEFRDFFPEIIWRNSRYFGDDSFPKFIIFSAIISRTIEEIRCSFPWSLDKIRRFLWSFDESCDFFSWSFVEFCNFSLKHSFEEFVYFFSQSIWRILRFYFPSSFDKFAIFFRDNLMNFTFLPRDHLTNFVIFFCDRLKKLVIFFFS